MMIYIGIFAGRPIPGMTGDSSDRQLSTKCRSSVTACLSKKKTATLVARRMTHRHDNVWVKSVTRTGTHPSGGHSRGSTQDTDVSQKSTWLLGWSILGTSCGEKQAIGRQDTIDTQLDQCWLLRTSHCSSCN